MSILSHTQSPVTIAFTHEPWCETEFHHLPSLEAGAEAPEPCVSPVLMDLDGAVAYARSTPAGPVVVLDAAATFSVADFERFCRDGLQAAAGLRVPAPRPDSGHVRIGHALTGLGLLGGAAIVPALSSWPGLATAFGVAAVVGLAFLLGLLVLACRGVRADQRRTAANIAAHARLSRPTALDQADVTVTVTVLSDAARAITAGVTR